MSKRSFGRSRRSIHSFCPPPAIVTPVSKHLHETHLQSAFPVSMSRACLGKMIVPFINCAGKAPVPGGPVQAVAAESVPPSKARAGYRARVVPRAVALTCGNNAYLYFECFPYVCPEPVLVNRSSLVYKCSKKGVSCPSSGLAVLRRRTCGDKAHASCLQENATLSEVSLCSSRACLGKMIVFSKKPDTK